MLWIALNLSQLPLDTLLRLHQAATVPADGKIPATPFVVLHKKRIGWCNATATEAGIECGMSDTDAWSRSAALQIYTRNFLQEQQALQEAALWALHFTPHVTLRSPSPDTMQNCGLLAEVAPSLRLFNGLSQLLGRLAQGIAELGLQASWASAPTATAAWLLAQSAPRWTTSSIAFNTTATVMAASDTSTAAAPMPPMPIPIHVAERSPYDTSALLDALPLQVLDAAQEHLAALQDIGCTTLGQLRRLPRGGLTRRFGKALLIQLDCAHGTQAEAHDWFIAPATIDLKLVLPTAVDNTQALLFASRRLLLQLTGWLKARHCAVAGMTLWLHHEPARRRDHAALYSSSNSYSTPVIIVLAAPSRDAEHLGLLLRERLTHVKLPAPVVEIALTTDQVTSQPGLNSELFPTVTSDIQSISRLIERFQSRLGVQAVCQVGLHADHRPERSCISVGSLQPGASPRRGRSAASATSSLYAATRPGWLLPQPLALLTRQHKPFYQSALTLLAGPERIETGWWDDALALRDYFIAQNDRHMLLWIFRLRPDGQGKQEDWFLHGFFA